jgi:hypothetical protein
LAKSPVLPSKEYAAMGDSSTLPQFKVRLTPDVSDRVKQCAKERRVSQSKEIADRVARSFDKDPLVGLAADVKRLVKLQGAR